MKPITLERRPCQLGPSINSRREKHGTENVPACDITVRGLLLTKPELDKLVGKGYWDSVYESRSGGQPPTPAWPKVKAGKYGEKLEADLAISFLSESLKPIEITEAKINRLEFDYQVGGLTACNFTISTAQDDVDLNKLSKHMDGEIYVECELREPKEEKPKANRENEPELNLGHPNGAEEGGEGGESPAGADDGDDAVGPETRAAVKRAAKKAPTKRAKRSGK
jgi:hypothetical protein